jgi:hypothetical protein
MKKLILQSIILLILTVFVENTKAQTKDETIKWINEKINHTAIRSWINIDCKFTNGDEHYVINATTLALDEIITITIKSRYTKDFSPQWKETEYYFNINNLTNVEMCSECNSCTSRPMILYFHSGSVKANYSDANGKSTLSLDKEVYLYMNWQAEPDLQNRMIKAFLHLIELNGNKEAF